MSILSILLLPFDFLFLLVSLENETPSFEKRIRGRGKEKKRKEKKRKRKGFPFLRTRSAKGRRVNKNDYGAQTHDRSKIKSDSRGFRLAGAKPAVDEGSAVYNGVNKTTLTFSHFRAAMNLDCLPTASRGNRSPPLPTYHHTCYHTAVRVQIDIREITARGSGRSTNLR